MLDRKTPPPFVKSTSFNLIEPRHTGLGNGAQLYFVPGGTQEVMKIEVIFRAGRWYEHAPAASHFTANLLTKGTELKSSFEIAHIFDRYGAHVEINPGFDFVSISVYTLTQYLAPVLELFIEVLTRPSFPKKELDQHKAIFIQNLKVNEEKTSFLASKAFRKNLFGADHPYGREIEEQQVTDITTDHLRNHYTRFFASPVVFVSGRIDGVSETLIRGAFETLLQQGETFLKYDSPGNGTFHEEIRKEGSVQASIRYGRRSILRSHPDYNGLIFVCHILGGYFGSRLMKNIREEKGLTYGIYASLHPMQQDSFLLVGADVNRENTQVTLREIAGEMRRLRTEPVPAEELETARNHFIGSLQLEMTTPFAHADKIKTIVLGGLPFDFYQKMIHDVNIITADQAASIADRHLHEDTMSSVAVG